MKTNGNRRTFLQTTALAGTALLLPINKLQALPLPTAKTPPITADEIAAIDAALGKKENFDLPLLDAIVKYTGTLNGQTYKYTIGRADLKVTAMGVEMTTNIGLNSWASFAGKQGDAHIAGDIAMLQSEVNSVIKTLREHNLEVVAVHNHMLSDEPHMIFLHYYGRGNAATLAQGFRAALDILGKAPMGGMKM
jgi:hypothetical protein